MTEEVLQKAPPGRHGADPRHGCEGGGPLGGKGRKRQPAGGNHERHGKGGRTQKER